MTGYPWFPATVWANSSTIGSARRTYTYAVHCNLPVCVIYWVGPHMIVHAEQGVNCCKRIGCNVQFVVHSEALTGQFGKYFFEADFLWRDSRWIQSIIKDNAADAAVLMVTVRSYNWNIHSQQIQKHVWIKTNHPVLGLLPERLPTSDNKSNYSKSFLQH